MLDFEKEQIHRSTIRSRSIEHHRRIINERTIRRKKNQSTLTLKNDARTRSHSEDTRTSLASIVRQTNTTVLDHTPTQPPNIYTYGSYSLKQRHPKHAAEIDQQSINDLRIKDSLTFANTQSMLERSERHRSMSESDFKDTFANTQSTLERPERHRSMSDCGFGHTSTQQSISIQQSSAYPNTTAQRKHKGHVSI